MLDGGLGLQQAAAGRLHQAATRLGGITFIEWNPLDGVGSISFSVLGTSLIVLAP